MEYENIIKKHQNEIININNNLKDNIEIKKDILNNNKNKFENKKIFNNHSPLNSVKK